MTDNRALWELVEKWDRRVAEDVDADRVRTAISECADEVRTILERPVVVGDSPAKVCSWHQCDDEGGAWDTGCGHMFEFTADGPEENNFTHCCFCGGTLDENPWVASEDESDESMVRGKS